MSPVACAVCGLVAASGAEGGAAGGAAIGAELEMPPLGWSTSNDARGTSQLCPRCSRDHVRSIESKLDEAWWT